jgi:hypothetical protein
MVRVSLVMNGPDQRSCRRREPMTTTTSLPAEAVASPRAGSSGRNPALQIDPRVDLELFDEHRFGSGVVHLRYRVQ